MNSQLTVTTAKHQEESMGKNWISPADEENTADYLNWVK